MKTEKPLVSVIIATYNMAHYLAEAIESVLGQSWENLELIIVDDGSTDNTSEVIAHFDDARLKYIPTPNQGQPKAKNLGLQEAKGQFIAFCDGDDFWDKDKLKIQIPYFEDPQVGIVYSEVAYVDEDGKHLDKPIPYQRYSGRVTDKLVIKNFVPFGTAVIREECLSENGGFDEELPMGIDWDLWLRYSVSWSFKYVPKKTYVYRIWSGQMSKDYRGRYKNAFQILEKFINLHPDQVPEDLKARAWADMYISRAKSLAASEKSFIEPFKDVLKGIGCDIFYWPAWKTLAKLLLRRV